MHRDEYDAALRRGIELGLEAAAGAADDGADYWRSAHKDGRYLEGRTDGLGEAAVIIRNLDPETIATIAARLAREGWTPPEPADPDLLAFREWEASAFGPADIYRAEVLAGKHDRGAAALTYLAGARMAREREQERAKVLVEYVRADTAASDSLTRNLAYYTLAQYRGEA